MNTIEAIKARRSVKHYDSEHRISHQETERLISLAMLSPTAFNIQNTRFVVVHDPALRKEIREAAWGQSQVTEASLLIILCADLKSWHKDPKRYWRNAPQEVQDQMAVMIQKFYDDNEQLQRDEAMRSCGIAAQTLMLAAKSMGYDSCPMDGFDFDAVARLINLPEDHVISMFVVIGKAKKEARPRGGQLSISERLITDKFGSGD